MTINTATNLSALITSRQSDLGIVTAELARALGYDQEHVVELITQGRMRLPINKVNKLARALSLDPKLVLRLAMESSAPGLLDAIEDVLNPLKLSGSEERLIKHCRKLARGRDAAPIVIDGNGVIALITT